MSTTLHPDETAAVAAARHAAEAAAAARSAQAERTAEQAAEHPAAAASDSHDSETFEEAAMTPAQRLEASRTRLRLAMLPPPATAGRRAASGPGASFFTDLPARLAALPVVGPLLDSVLAWWERSPLRPAAQMATEASASAVAPVARRHPWLLVLGAALAGALLVWSRPWRWLFRSAVVAGLVPRMASRAVAGLPLSTILKLFGTSLARSRRAEDATTAAAAAMAGDAPGRVRTPPPTPAAAAAAGT